jgi:hypothetical protein
VWKEEVIADMERKRLKKSKYQTRPTGTKRKRKIKKERELLAKFYARENRQEVAAKIALSRKFENKKALDQQKRIKENRQNFIDVVRTTWRALDGPGWEEYFRNRKRIKQELKIFSGRKDHYRKHGSVPEGVLDKADMLISLLKALEQWNKDDILEAIKPFKWPSFKVHTISQICANPIDVDDTGILSHFGYRVGKNGLHVIERCEILEEILSTQNFDSEFSDKILGTPFSCPRLKHVVYQISFFIRNAKHQLSKDYSEAIADWESDLNYLKIRHYNNKCNPEDFYWPYI